MKGMDWNDPLRIRSPKELINYINQVGFLPLFANEIPGFSVEEHVSDLFWWTDDPEQDPWKWREILAEGQEVLYGKFFGKKAGFISREWFPIFANLRRDGYDFDARWEDELASRREKKIMDQFGKEDAYYSCDLKKAAGFGKEGEKNFDGVITDLQMKGYVVIREFKCRRRKKDGAAYGWPLSIYTIPEKLLGYDAFEAAYREDPKKSAERMCERILQEYPWADPAVVRKAVWGIA